MKKINKSIVKPVKKNVTNIFETATKTGNLLIQGSNDYAPNVKKILSQYGPQIIKALTLKRTPVDKVLTGALNIFSLGKFGERFEKSFDELFHLFLEIELQSGTRLLLEKNARINMELNPVTRPNTEIKAVTNIPQELSVYQLLENAKRRMGSQFYSYDAVNNNCQDFLLNVLQSSGIGDQSDYAFIKQDTAKLFKGLPILKKVAHTATELGERADIAMQGGNLTESDVENINNYSKFLEHLTSHITDPKEPIDVRDYQQAIKIINIIKQLKENKLSGSGLKKNVKIDIQSIVFLKKDDWTTAKAKKWLKDRKFKTPSPDITEHTLRFRQIDPSKYKEFKTRKLSNGILLIFGLE
jgi:hypothetical protein